MDVSRVDEVGGVARSGNGDSGPGPAKILVVDDQDDSRRALVRVLEALGYRTVAAPDGEAALSLLNGDIDLVTLDADMPVLDGFEVARRIRDRPASLNLPIIMVTGLTSRDDRLRAFEAGVNDFLVKPFDVDEVRLRVHWLLKLKRAYDDLERHKSHLEDLVAQRTVHLRQALADTMSAQERTREAHLDTIRRLVVAAEYKDRDTASHIERIGRMSELMAKRLALSGDEVHLIRHATTMHDVGKIGVPDHILLKPGALTEAEWGVMRQHTVFGERILSGSQSPLLVLGERVARSHHERWDGSGYPDGVAGDGIPLAARICAIVDVFDALASHRHYRDALPLPTVWGMIEKESGAHFDPEIAETFCAARRDVEALWQAVGS